MNWGAIKPVLVDVELYTSLLVNIYAVLFALSYAIRWLAGRARRVTLPPSDVLSSAIADAFNILVALGLVIGFVLALVSLLDDAGFPDWSALVKWLKALIG